jgi:hypothetical protein
MYIVYTHNIASDVCLWMSYEATRVVYYIHKRTNGPHPVSFDIFSLLFSQLGGKKRRCSTRCIAGPMATKGILNRLKEDMKDYKLLTFLRIDNILRHFPNICPWNRWSFHWCAPCWDPTGTTFLSKRPAIGNWTLQNKKWTKEIAWNFGISLSLSLLKST